MQQSLEKFEISVTPSLENPLCLPLHNLPDSMFDGLIHVKVLTQNGEPRHTKFQNWLTCNTQLS